MRKVFTNMTCILTDLDAGFDPTSRGLYTIIRWQILIIPTTQRLMVFIHLRLIFPSQASGRSRPCLPPF